MTQFGKLSLVPLLLLAIDDANAAKSDDGEKIDLTVIEARLDDVETAVAGNDTDIGNLQTAVAGNDTDIGNLQTAVSGNDTDIGGLQSDVGALQTDVASLQSQVDSQAQDIAALGVNAVVADCGADVGALQAAVDAAPAAGAIINVSGVCDAVDITGKSNILIDGGDVASANGVSGDLLVSASNNVQISGFTSASALITNNSSVFFNDVNVDGDVNIAVNGSLTQTGGELNFLGNMNASEGAQARISNGTVSGEVTATRNATVLLTTGGVDDGSTIDVDLGVRVFSGASVLGQSNQPSNALNISGNLFVQRNASIFLSGPTVTVEVPRATVRFNSTLDILSLAEENFIVPQIFIQQGGGARGFFGPAFDPSAVLFTAACDDSAWTAINIACAP